MKRSGNAIRLRSSIQMKLIAVFVFTSVIILSVNLFMFININGRIQKIDEVYSSNVTLNQLTENLSLVQNYMTEYLNTKNFDAMQNYYKSEKDYQELIASLYNTATNSNSRLMEKNIRNLSEKYLEYSNATVDAKRGRMIEKYNVSNKQATEMFDYINTYIYSLNNERFKTNSENYNALLVSLESLEYISTLILLAVTVTNIILAMMLTRSITNPLSQLARAANEVGAGNLEVQKLEVKNADEIGVVTNAFNKMTLSIRAYIQSTKESMELERAMKEKELMMETHLKDAQLKYLQAQINPHFLFNTLNAGAQLAMMEGADRTYTFIDNMAAFFRYSIKKDNHSTTLADEITLVDNYIYILNVRFSNEIQYVKEVEEALCDVRVPSMILQPIVENCINYGIRDIGRQGIITLSVYPGREEICVCVRDNGVGITPERIEEIRSGVIKEKEQSGDSNGIGLNNVIERLKMFYDRDEVLEIIAHGENKGTEVLLHIPLPEGE